MEFSNLVNISDPIGFIRCHLQKLGQVYQWCHSYYSLTSPRNWSSLQKSQIVCHSRPWVGSHRTNLQIFRQLWALRLTFFSWGSDIICQWSEVMFLLTRTHCFGWLGRLYLPREDRFTKIRPFIFVFRVWTVLNKHSKKCCHCQAAVVLNIGIEHIPVSISFRGGTKCVRPYYVIMSSLFYSNVHVISLMSLE